MIRAHIFAIAFLAWNVCAAQSKNTVERGHTLFRASCGGCHSFACNRQGPKLEGLFGRRAGSVSDFPHYTPELKASGIVWTDETVDTFLLDPDKLVPGTAMAGWGKVTNASDRKALIAYIRRQDRSFDLCPK